MNISGAELTIRLLERENVRIVAGIPGGANLPLYDALSSSERIHHVLARHEQGAGFIAQGIARTTGRAGVCFATSGPGAVNAMTAIADAHLDSVPIVCITGQVPRNMIGTDAFQEVDTYGMSIPITKHNFLVRSAGELAQAIPEAFRIALSGRPGPVLIDIPKDVQREQIELSELPAPSSPDAHPEPDSASLDRAAELIRRAKRPVVCIGGGAICCGASQRAIELAQRIDAAIVTTLMGLGAAGHEHPQSLGMLGMHAFSETNHAIAECDLLIVVGARFDDRATGNVEKFCPEASVVHIDIDPGEIHKIRQAHAAIIADANIAMRELMPRIKPAAREEWLTRIDALKRQYRTERIDTDDPAKPQGLIRCCSELSEDDAIIVTDVGQHQMWAAQSYPLCPANTWLTSGGLGTMGFGLPVAIGAALANPQKRVVCFTGDGGLLMNVQEFATAADENLTNLTVVLMNNDALGLVRQQQELFYGKRKFASEFRTRTDFTNLAKCFGVRAVDLSEGDARAKLQIAFDKTAPTLVHAPIDPNEMVLPIVPPGAANSEMITRIPGENEHAIC